MATRISGLSSGLDTDSIIKETMKAYQTRIDKKKQERDVTEAQQDQYRELVKASQDFFNKYFDITKSDSLLRDGSYKTVGFTAGDGSEAATNNAAVTAKGLAGAVVDNYKVEVQALAQPAQQKFSQTEFSGLNSLTVNINSQDVTITRGTQSDTDFLSSINSKLTSVGMKMSFSQFDNKYTLGTSATGTTASFKLSYATKQQSSQVTSQNYDDTTLSNMNSITINKGGIPLTINRDSGTDNVAFRNKIQSTLATEPNLTNFKMKAATDGSNVITISNDTVADPTDPKFTITSTSVPTSLTTISGYDAKVSITNSKGQCYVPQDLHSNTVIVDNVQFNFNGVTGDFKQATPPSTGYTPSATAVSLTGTTDVKDLKDKIVKFVDDYNTLIGKFNTKIYETRNKNFMPLTDEQKSAMTEKQIETWEKKATTGLLRRDSDLQRITQGMKSAMGATQALLQSSGLSLEKIGIEPVKNYTDKNGTYKVNGDKLEEALKTNAEQIKTMFTKLPSSDTANDGGILQKLKKVLDDETMSSDSILSNKAGFEGTATYLDNTLTKKLKEEQKKIDEMTKSLSDREQKLYSKYSKLETAMNSLNSQQDWLTQQTAQ